MAKGKKKTKSKSMRKLDPQILSQADMLMDRLRAQDPEGESLGHFLESLRVTLGNNQDLAVAFLEKIGESGDIMGGRVFTELENLFNDKKYRKAARRAKFCLTQKGILTDDQKAISQKKQVHYIVSQSKDRLPISYMGITQPSGAIIILTFIPGIVAEDTLLFFVIDENRQIEEADLNQADYGSAVLKEAIDQLKSGYSGTQFVEIPTHYAAFLFEESYQRSESQEGEKVLRVRNELKRFFTGEKKPLIYSHLGKEQIKVSDEILEKSTQLFYEKSFPLRFLSKSDALPLLDKLKSIFESTIIVSPPIKKEQVKEAIRDFLIDYFKGPKKECFQRCLQDIALVYWLKGQQEKSLWVLAVNEDIEKGVSEEKIHPFLEKFLFRTASLAFVEELEPEDLEFFFDDSLHGELEDISEEEETPSLIVTPYD